MVEKWYRYGHFYWLAFAIFFVYYARAISIDEYRNSEIVKGVVVKKLEERGRRGRINYYPQFEFVYRDTVRYNADDDRNARIFYPGKKIKVIVPKDDPSNATIYTFFSFWLDRTPLLYCVVIGLLLFALPLIARNFSRDISS